MSGLFGLSGYKLKKLNKPVDVEYKDCSPTWKKLKEHIRHDPKAREEFILKLKKALCALIHCSD